MVRYFYSMCGLKSYSSGRHSGGNGAGTPGPVLTANCLGTYGGGASANRHFRKEIV